MKKIIISTLVVAMATPAFADKEGDGTIIGAIVGGLAGNIIGGKKGKTERTVIGALLGAVIGNRIGNDMDKADRAELERASNDCFNGNAGRSVDWNGRKYRGRVSTTREGSYRRGDGGRVRCRDYRSEIYRGNEREIIEGTVCEGRNGWERTERRDIDYGYSDYGNGSGTMGGSVNGGYNNSLNVGQTVDLGFLNPVSRRGGGDYLTLNVNGLNLRKITLRASGDRLKVYRVIATGINGRQVELVANQSADQFLYLGGSASYDTTGVGSQIVQLNILAEAWAAGLGISVSAEIGNSNSNGNMIPRDNGIGGGRGDRPRPQARVESCEAIARINSTNASRCVDALAGQYIDPNADRACAAIANINSSNALECVRSAAGARFTSREALDVCAKISNINSANAARCVAALANRDVDERFVGSCSEAANTNSASALDCIERLTY